MDNIDELYEKGWNYYRNGHTRKELFSYLKSFDLDYDSAVQLWQDIISEADDDYDI